MTAAESALADAQRDLESQFPTQFRVDGCDACFVGVVSGERDSLEAGAGGMVEQREITLSANKTQFYRAGVVITPRSTHIILNGRRWIVHDMPDRNEPNADYRMRCRTDMTRTR